MTEEEKKAEKAFEESLNLYLVGDIAPDANLVVIKAKQSEIISKQRSSTKEYLKRRKELLDIERREMASYSYHSMRVLESNKGLTHAAKLNKDDKEKRIKYLVDRDEEKGTNGIYDKIELIKYKVFVFETILKNNKMISDRVENMLNAQINIDKQSIKNNLIGEN